MEESAQAPAFGVLLKRYRRAANFTQELLAERAGYSAIYLSKLERGERLPLAFTVATLSDALGLDAEERAALEHAAQRVPAAPREQPEVRIPAGGDSLVPLVGRTGEQTLLERYLAGEEPPLLAVLGEPGIGKTRLLQEAVQQGQQHGWRVLEGRCHRHSGQELYAPLLVALERALAQLPQAEQREALQQCEWLLRLFPERAEEVDLSLPSWEVSPAQERRLLFAAMRRFLDHIAGPAGTLLVLDDLQWVSADTLDVLTSLFRADGRRPLRLIGAYRHTEVLSTDALSLALADIAREVGAQRLQIGPLPAQEAEHLLNLLLEGSAVDPEEQLVEMVLRRAGGVPYFLVSCAQGLRAGTLGGTASEAIPWQVTETIRQRVGALSEAAQYLLGVVAVAGSEARRPLLLALATQLGWGNREALLALEQACQARLLVELDEHSYTFPHDLIREVLIEDMSAARRGMLHQHIAEILQQGGAQPPVEALAYHYSQAGLYEQAMGYLEQAGDHARTAYAHEQAERYYRAWRDQAIRLERPAEAARAHLKLGGVLFVCGHYPEAIVLLKEALALYQKTNDLEGQAEAAGKIGRVYAALGDSEKGIPFLQRWLASPHLHTLSASRRGALYLTLTYLLMNSSRNTEALTAVQQAVALAEQTQDVNLLCTAQRYLGRALMLLGRLKEAVQTLEATIPLAEQGGDLRSLCSIFFNLGLITYERGDPVAGKAYAERAALLAEQVGTPVLLAHVVANRGWNAFVLGDWQHARKDYEQAISLLRQAGTPWGTANALLDFGMLLLAQGRTAGRASVEEAIELARGSEDALALRMAQRVLAEQELLLGAPKQACERLEPLLKEEQQDRLGLLLLLPRLAWAQLELGNESQAQRLLEQMRAGATVKQFRPLLAEASIVQAQLAAHQKQWQTAEKTLEAALHLCREMPWPYGEAKTLYVAGLVSRQRGETAQARAHFEAALTILQRLGERLYARVIQQALAQLPAHKPQARGA